MTIRHGEYQRRSVLFDNASANSSTYTSQAHYVGDYQLMTVELPITINSGVSLEGTNDDGYSVNLNSAGTWSTVTRITSAGLYTVDPGFSWMRARRQSTDSQAAVILKGRT